MPTFAKSTAKVHLCADLAQAESSTVMGDFETNSSGGTLFSLT